MNIHVKEKVPQLALVLIGLAITIIALFFNSMSLTEVVELTNPLKAYYVVLITVLSLFLLVINNRSNISEFSTGTTIKDMLLSISIAILLFKMVNLFVVLILPIVVLTLVNNYKKLVVNKQPSNVLE